MELFRWVSSVFTTSPQSMKIETTLPPKIELDAFLLDKDDASMVFVECMKQKGFGIFRLNEETEVAIQNYLAATRGFFAEDDDYKNQFAVHKQIIDVKRRVNHGYVTVDKVKEYLKKGRMDTDEVIPDKPEQLKSDFNKVLDCLEKIAERALTVIGGYTYEDGESHFDKNLRLEVTVAARQRSSISVIHYYPQAEERAVVEDKQEYYEKQEGQEVKVVVHPSSVHVDTGLFTLIVCAPVPGLQVQDRESQKFLEVEKIVDPKKDLFIIMGRKIAHMSTKGEKSVFQPTVHRVVLPANVERTSLLYFQDVVQT